MIDLDQLVAKTRELTPFPASTVRLAQLVAGQNYNLTDVTALVAYDEVLTMKLLRAANSAAVGGRRKVTTPYEAIILFGTTLVLELAISDGAKPHLRAKLPEYGLAEGALWRHSVASAVAAEMVSGFCTTEIPAEAFAACLLHDVGKVIMSRFLSPEILRFIALAKEGDGLNQIEAESCILNVHHGELGGLIAQHWQLPPRIVQGIIYHHNPDEGRDVVCDFAYVANQVAKGIEAHLDQTMHCYHLPAGTAERVGITEERLEALGRASIKRFQEVSRFYNVR